MENEAESTGWILRDGKHYYRGWVTGFGPMCTSNVEEAHVFTFHDEAVQSRAFNCQLMNFLPVAKSDAVVTETLAVLAALSTEPTKET
jgi:hypothetical protein